MVAPKALVQKTQEQLAYQKFNPRPPSSHLNKNFKAAVADDEDDYEEGDGFEKEDEDDDLKLEKIKQAMKRENAMARQQAASKATPAMREKTSVLKQGPLAPGQRKDSQQVLQRFTQAEDEEIIEDVSRGQQKKMAVPA